jgi:hypothetical protein
LDLHVIIYEASFYENWPLLMKMALDLIVVPLVASNFDLLFNVEILWFVLFQRWKFRIPW